jgi:hypothetical protein
VAPRRAEGVRTRKSTLADGLQTQRSRLEARLDDAAMSHRAALLEEDGHPPPTLYHYTGADGLIGIVTSGRLWASGIGYMNDATEETYAASVIQRAVDDVADRIPRSEIMDIFRQMVVPRIGHSSDAMARPFAACFSAVDDLLSQWRGYGSGVGGYALGFASNQINAGSVDDPVPTPFTLRKVIYDPDRQRDLAVQVTEAIMSVVASLEPHIRRGADAAALGVACGSRLSWYLTELLVSFKHRSFAEEEEWRLVHLRPGQASVPGAPVERSPVSVRAGAGFLVPYVELVTTRDLLTEADRVPLVDVVRGPSPQPELADDALRLLLEQAAYSDVQIRPSAVPLRA